jgi:hypothetical protein
MYSTFKGKMVLGSTFLMEEFTGYNWRLLVPNLLLDEVMNVYVSEI